MNLRVIKYPIFINKHFLFIRLFITLIQTRFTKSNFIKITNLSVATSSSKCVKYLKIFWRHITPLQSLFYRYFSCQQVDISPSFPKLWSDEQLLQQTKRIALTLYFRHIVLGRKEKFVVWIKFVLKRMKPKINFLGSIYRIFCIFWVLWRINRFSKCKPGT